MTAFRMSERSASRRAGSVDRGAARLPSPAPAYAIHVPRSARPPPPPPLHGRWSSPRGTESLRSASSAGSLGAYVATAGRDAEARRRAAAMTEAIRAGRRHAASPAATWSPRRSPARLRTAPARVTQLCDESAPAPAFCFARRDTPFDWRQLTALSVEQIRRDTDVAALDRVLDTVAFGDAAANDLRDVDPNVLKVLQLAQLTIEYLLHCQATRQAEGDDLAAALSRADVLSATQADRNDALEAALHDLKKENRQLRKTLYAYQMVTKLPAGHNTAGLAHYYDCAWCTKVFTTPAYLRSHCERRHPDQLERETPAADAASHPLAPAPAPAPVPAPAPAPPAVEPRPSETDKIEAMLHAFQSQVLDAAQRMHREVAENERHEKRHEAEVSALLKDEHARLAAELAEMRRLLELQRAETLASADRERAERDAVARAERAPTAHGASTVAMADESFSDDEPPAPPAPAPPAPAPATIVVADPAVRDDIDALRRDMQQEADRFDAAQLRIAQLEAVLAHHQRLREAQTQTPALPEAVQPPSPPAPVALPTPPLEPIVAAPPPAPAPAAAPASMLQPAAAPAKKALKSAMKPPPGLTWTQVRKFYNAMPTDPGRPWMKHVGAHPRDDLDDEVHAIDAAITDGLRHLLGTAHGHHIDLPVLEAQLGAAEQQLVARSQRHPDHHLIQNLHRYSAQSLVSADVAFRDSAARPDYELARGRSRSPRRPEGADRHGHGHGHDHRHGHRHRSASRGRRASRHAQRSHSVPASAAASQRPDGAPPGPVLSDPSQLRVARTPAPARAAPSPETMRAAKAALDAALAAKKWKARPPPLDIARAVPHAGAKLAAKLKAVSMKPFAKGKRAAARDADAASAEVTWSAADSSDSDTASSASSASTAAAAVTVAAATPPLAAQPRGAARTSGADVGTLQSVPPLAHATIAEALPATAPRSRAAQPAARASLQSLASETQRAQRAAPQKPIDDASLDLSDLSDGDASDGDPPPAAAAPPRARPAAPVDEPFDLSDITDDDSDGDALSDDDDDDDAVLDHAFASAAATAAPRAAPTVAAQAPVMMTRPPTRSGAAKRGPDAARVPGGFPDAPLGRGAGAAQLDEDSDLSDLSSLLEDIQSESSDGRGGVGAAAPYASNRPVTRSGRVPPPTNGDDTSDFDL